MINENFRIITNKDAKRYEFRSQTNVFNSYTVGFHEVDCLDDAYIAVWKALNRDIKKFNDLSGQIITGC